MEDNQCLVCQKDLLMNALQPAYQLLPQLLQWVPPYRRPVLGDGHIHLHGKKKSTGKKWKDTLFAVYTYFTTWGHQSECDEFVIQEIFS